MAVPERFSFLPPYIFARLRALLDEPVPDRDVVVDMAIGEPRHAFPDWVVDIILEHSGGFNNYPSNDGVLELRQAISTWISRRYGVSVDPETQVLTLNGMREGLYNTAMALCPDAQEGASPLILCPNPFYQVYMVAALSVGAMPVFVPPDDISAGLPNYFSLSPDILNRTEIVYVCSPSNPQGAVASLSYWTDLIALSEKYDFKIFADECYSEIYRGDPPAGALQAAAAMGADPERVLVFHSLSKRSNLPGLRSGFVAGGSDAIKACKMLRAYAGSPLPNPLQKAAAKVWLDEEHVEKSRQLYLAKYQIAERIFEGVDGFVMPEAGFFLWLPVNDGEEAARKLWKQEGIRVLPGAYLAQERNGENPGRAYIRVAMVAAEHIVEQGLLALHNCLYAEGGR